MACDFFRFFFSIILIRFLCPRFLHYFICFETTCFVWFFDFLIACHSFPKKRKFRRRERTMPGGHGAVQSAEVGVMQIWFSFNIKNGGFLIRWLSFFRLTDALLTWKMRNYAWSKHIFRYYLGFEQEIYCSTKGASSIKYVQVLW